MPNKFRFYTVHKSQGWEDGNLHDIYDNMTIYVYELTKIINCIQYIQIGSLSTQ